VNGWMKKRDKKVYALIGAGFRAAFMYVPLLKEFEERMEIGGIFDSNPARSEAVKKLAGLGCPVYDDCDRMLAEVKPDTAIITTVDRYHHQYIIKCLEAGVDVIVEKPMTIDEEKCKAILDAERRTDRKVIVTFNYRFTPYVTAVKQVIKDGLIGEILNVDFEYLLDTRHGANYFRRWHRRKENSGGLLVHKSTHHFDLVNWWIEEEPVEVMAFGSRRFYGPTREERGERCLTCRYKKTCEFHIDMEADKNYRIMYLDCEKADDYYRDRCVFSEEIDIEDSMSVNVKYSKGTLLSYSLIAHSPYEGYKAAINGTQGRLEISEYHSGIRAGDSAYCFDIYDRQGRKASYTVPKAEGGHGGGDARLIRMILEGGNAPDPLGHQAGSFAGAVSILIGIAANKSIREGRNIRIKDLIPLDEYR